MTPPPILKYPRTPHLLDSALQPGDETLGRDGFEAIAGRPLVVEEKLDGANAAISFAPDGALLLQSRGHYLTGGPRERHFALFKAWAASLRDALWNRIGARFVVYGEWLYAKHTIFYDALPAYFLEFDMLDRETGAFLSTDRRAALLDGLGVAAVPVLHRGPIASADALRALIGPPAHQTPHWRDRLLADAAAPPHRPERALSETDGAGLMEGLYVKAEEDGVVSGRWKYVRAGFLTVVRDSESHWLSRPILPNALADV